MMNEIVEQRIPYMKEAVEQWFLPSNEAVEQLCPHANKAVEQRLSLANEAVEQGIQHDDAAVEQGLPPRANGAVENELSRLEEGEDLSSESDSSVLTRGSRRTKTSRSQRRLKPRRSVHPPSAPTESVCTVEYVDGEPYSLHRGRESASRRQVSHASPGRSSFETSRPETLSKCASSPMVSVSHAINSVDSADTSPRPKSAELKSARIEHLAVQSWESLKASGNPIYETACEFSDVFQASSRLGASRLALTPSSSSLSRTRLGAQDTTTTWRLSLAETIEAGSIQRNPVCTCASSSLDPASFAHRGLRCLAVTWALVKTFLKSVIKVF
ncbi:hypothetical protein PF003_g40452 [Phytophthora fragariae]|nr:hypothetical protein PF003_g40452 [Phytophthora fragariae]